MELSCFEGVSWSVADAHGSGSVAPLQGSVSVLLKVTKKSSLVESSHKKPFLSVPQSLL